MKTNKDIYLGAQKLTTSLSEVQGTEVKIDGESYYKIANYDTMRPFFMSIVSNSNHWMFLSSTGGLTAGRKNSNFALFPYYTDDKITESSETTGSKTLCLVTRSEKTSLWEPFSTKYQGLYKLSRNLYKNSYGNKVKFEEVNHDLGLTFSYEWNSSDKFGFLRKSALINHGSEAVSVQFIDGLQNLLPYGVEDALQNASSNLVDAYKKCELEASVGLGLFSLSAIIVDKAEPSEALRSNVAWSLGRPNAIKLLSSKQLDAFRKGELPTQEVDIKAERGAYMICDSVELASGATEHWSILADVNKGPVEVADLMAALKHPEVLLAEVAKDVEEGSEHLVELVAASDGLQLTNDRLLNIRHFANTMFNIMRGGIFDDNYTIEKDDFTNYIHKANIEVFKRVESTLEELDEVFTLQTLKTIAAKATDADFKRLSYEYLPLKFSRRHGDPSRPWNKFSINTRNEVDGSKILDYQGNWRDIFQNWEALAHSYPEFMEGMIHKFLNATTFDGYNPYRVIKDGFDWETIEPDNPWSYIGYWGDHQIIYLLKFLEFIEEYYPGKLKDYFTQDHFVYANVPYRIKEYADLLKDPKNTIDFDHEAEEAIQAKRASLGIDGALIVNASQAIHKVNFIEKILATVLAKVSNFIPEGGIWMNTQRPEWNDANNALVGNGVSMVTLNYLRRFLSFMDHLLADAGEEVKISAELATFFTSVKTTLEAHQNLLNSSISDADRKLVLDGVGQPASAYRKGIYETGFSGTYTSVAIADIRSFTKTANAYMEHSIDANKRADGLYHAYNLMTVTETGVKISYLPEMLEGQVAVLSSKYLSAHEGAAVLDALKASALFREDQYSYILYPNKELPRFVDKNCIPAARAEVSELAQTLVADGNKTVILKDRNGRYHFNGMFNNVNNLHAALDALPATYAPLVAKDRTLLATVFEEVFDHKSFTGRSGTFFGYEGLGSIYWHMVSKLLLATYENTNAALTGDDPSLVGRMFDHYFEVLAGIGVHKSPELYGAFPTDPYSHTPGGKGAQQPGMTGQVKEDLICRFGELGVHVTGGQLSFVPKILRKEEFLTQAKTFNYITLDNKKEHIVLDPDSLAFTYCQVPVVYRLGDSESITVVTGSASSTIKGSALTKEWTNELFQRTGKVVRLEVTVVK
ncbi:MAG: hypothetical protein L7S65_02505 [Schleiferiaceae bacterium]|nr:hypothetical protein [Schleiferiaceae bacterium]